MSSKLRQMHRAPAFLVACGLMLGAATTLAAQAGPRHGEGGGPGMGHAREGRGPDPVVFEGPPEPAAMKTLLKLDQRAGARYGTLYAELVSGTAAQRDSLRVLRGERMAAVAKGEVARGERPSATMRRLHLQLEERQEGFDAELKGLLTGEQWEAYGDWRQVRREEARAAMRQLHSGCRPGR